MVTHSDNIADILEICIERLHRGATVEECLRAFPAEAYELEPMLTAAQRVSTLPQPTLDPVARSAIQIQLRRAVVQQRARQRPERRPAAPGWLVKTSLRFAAVALLLMVVGLGGGVAAAQRSLPDSPFYPLKRATERTRLLLARSPEQRAALYLDFAATRSVELLTMASRQSPIDAAVVDDFEQEYQQAWAEIEQVPGPAGVALRRQYIMSSSADVDVLGSAINADSAAPPALANALRASRQALSRATDTPPGSAPDPTAAPADPTEQPSGSTPPPTSPTTRPGNGNGGDTGNNGNGGGANNGGGNNGGNGANNGGTGGGNGDSGSNNGGNTTNPGNGNGGDGSNNGGGGNNANPGNGNGDGSNNGGGNTNPGNGNGGNGSNNGGGGNNANPGNGNGGNGSNNGGGGNTNPGNGGNGGDTNNGNNAAPSSSDPGNGNGASPGGSAPSGDGGSNASGGPPVNRPAATAAPKPSGGGNGQSPAPGGSGDKGKDKKNRTP